ncbi:MAG: hypothetical protein QXG09_02605 [Candidatus Bathyarchaeia archaeon]
MGVKAAEEADPVHACRQRLVEALERGKAYTVRDVKAQGLGYPDDVIMTALDMLVEEGKAFKLPTSPEKWFLEG